MAHGSGHEIGIRLVLLRDLFYQYADKEHAIKRDERKDRKVPNGQPTIVEYLQAHRVRVVKRQSIYEDFEVLREEFGMEIEYDKKKQGYILKNAPFEAYELRLMVESIQASKFITQEKARVITRKIGKLAGTRLRQEIIGDVDVADRVRSMNESVVKDADRIRQAIAENRKIGFRYFHYTPDKAKEKSYSKAGGRYVVSPYALQWNNGNYYLYAYDGKKFRYYRVDRMDGITHPLTLEREGKDEYAEQQAKARSKRKAKVFDMYGGKEYSVSMRFRNELADAVIDQFGKDIMMMPVDDEHFTITAPIEISPPFFAWIATFGRRAKILGPQPVVEEMKKFIGRVQDMYKDEGEM